MLKVTTPEHCTTIKPILGKARMTYLYRKQLLDALPINMQAKILQE